MNGWWQGAVFYQIYPRSFADADGDGIGDLAGITEKLDYVAELGVDAIWLSPFFVSPMKDFGYDVADYLDVDPIFGTIADFDRLIARAHQLGLKVIIDQVYSHSSDRHRWFEESRQDTTNPKADWYVWADAKPDGSPPNNWLSVFGGPAWTWDSRRRQYYFHNFLKEQPDLNFHQPAVRDAVLACAEFWLRRGVDGFRIDVANFFCHDRELRDNPPSGHPAPEKAYLMQRPVYTRNRPETLAFVAEFRALLDRYPGTMAVAEIAAEDQLGAMIAYTDGPDRYHTAYSFVFMRETFGAGFFRQAIEEMQARSVTAWPSWAFSNHDVVRVASRWARSAPSIGSGDLDPSFAKLLIAVLVSLRGTIFLYQGEELGLPHAEVPFERLQDPEGKAFWPRHRGRDGARTPMPWRANASFAGFGECEPWLPIDPRHLPLAVDQQEHDDASVLAFTRRFLAWRKSQPELVWGEIHVLDTPEPVLAWVRKVGDSSLLCVFNLQDRPCEVMIEAAAHYARSAVDPASLGLRAGQVSGAQVALPGLGALLLRAN
ncbi:MAG: alpha-glucosidase [Rhodospirillales bacterium]|nr:alpha-glucosidase [Rhodospirillales bacterium]